MSVKLLSVGIDPDEVKRGDMAVCTYDNPATMARECWQDGRLICHYSYDLLPPLANKPILAERFFFGANIGPWKLGQMVGDTDAFDRGEVCTRCMRLIALIECPLTAEDKRLGFKRRTRCPVCGDEVLHP